MSERKYRVRKDKKAPKYRSDIPGLAIRHNSKGWCIVELDYIADPNKRDPKWAVAEQKKYTTRAWRREMGRDWTTPSGEPYFPEFEFIEHQAVFPVTKLLPSVIYRGWDLGYYRPACVLMQCTEEGRVAAFREIVVTKTHIHDFRDLVRYLCGEVEEEYLHKRRRIRALQLLSDIRKGTKKRGNWAPRGYPTATPWVSPNQFKFVDFVGHEAMQHRASGASRRNDPDKNELQVLQQTLDVRCTPIKRDVREHVVRRLMGRWPDGRPGIVVDPACVYLLRALKGGLTFASPTAKDPHPRHWLADGIHDDPWDAFAYGASNLVSVTETEDVEVTYRWHGRVRVKEEPMEYLPFRETRSYNRRRA